MTRAVVFKTPGLIDIRAFTMFGVNSKPNSENPIGYFGTGLKYAIAVLLREKCQVEVWIGSTKHTFYQSDMKFRDKEFVGIRMKRETLRLGNLIGKNTQILPFTTELGKNWGLWQAFRELETNTRDEGGLTFLNSSGETWIGEKDLTYIVVTGEAFVGEFEGRDKTFLPISERTLVYETPKMQVFNGESKHIYYRGMRVLDLPAEKPSKYTYNILESTSLTEDRTLAYQFQVDQRIGSAIIDAPEEQEELISEVITSEQKFYEHSLQWDYLFAAPGSAFKRIIQQKHPRGITQGAVGYWKGYAPRAPVIDHFKDYPRPWTSEGHDIFDASGAVVLVGAADDECESKIPIPLIMKVVEIINNHSLTTSTESTGEALF